MPQSLCVMSLKGVRFPIGGSVRGEPIPLSVGAWLNIIEHVHNV